MQVAVADELQTLLRQRHFLSIEHRQRPKEAEDAGLTGNEMSDLLRLPSPVLEGIPTSLDGHLHPQVHVRRVDQVDRGGLGKGEDASIDGLDRPSSVDLGPAVDELGLLESV